MIPLYDVDHRIQFSGTVPIKILHQQFYDTYTSRRANPAFLPSLLSSLCPLNFSPTPLSSSRARPASPGDSGVRFSRGEFPAVGYLPSRSKSASSRRGCTSSKGLSDSWSPGRRSCPTSERDNSALAPLYSGIPSRKSANSASSLGRSKSLAVHPHSCAATSSPLLPSQPRHDSLRSCFPHPLQSPPSTGLVTSATPDSLAFAASPHPHRGCPETLLRVLPSPTSSRAYRFGGGDRISLSSPRISAGETRVRGPLTPLYNFSPAMTKEKARLLDLGWRSILGSGCGMPIIIHWSFAAGAPRTSEERTTLSEGAKTTERKGAGCERRSGKGDAVEALIARGSSATTREGWRRRNAGAIGIRASPDVALMIALSTTKSLSPRQNNETLKWAARRRRVHALRQRSTFRAHWSPRFVFMSIFDLPPGGHHRSRWEGGSERQQSPETWRQDIGGRNSEKKVCFVFPIRALYPITTR